MQPPTPAGTPRLIDSSTPDVPSRWHRLWHGRWLEAVSVLAVVGILAVMAGPRLSRAAVRADYAAVYGDLGVLRNAVQLYAADHGGRLPTANRFTAQMTGYSDATGEHLSDVHTLQTPLGPYLRQMLPVRVGDHSGSTAVWVVSGTPTQPLPGDDAGPGWLMDVHTGTVWPNAWGFLPEAKPGG